MVEGAGEGGEPGLEAVGEVVDRGGQLVDVMRGDVAVGQQ